MSKTLTADFIIEKNKATGAKPRTLFEIDTDGDTLYLSDQVLTVSGQAYTANIMAWPSRIRSQIRPGEEVVRTSSARFEINNNPRIDDDIRPGLEVRLYLWFEGLAAADKLLWFKGIINEDIEITAYRISFTAMDIGDWFDKQIGIPLDTATYPNADPDAKGLIQPILYGDLFSQPCIPIVAGGVSTLDGDYSGGATMDLLDASVFASSGTVIIGEETGTYSGKSTNQLTGVAGISGTYPHGTVVTEDVASLKYMVANHVVKAITNPRILLPGRTLDGAVAVEVANFSVTLDDAAFGGHIATVTLSNIDDIITKVSQVVVTQQPNQPITTHKIDVSPIHGHAEANKTVAYYMDTVSTTAGTFAFLARMVDRAFQSGVDAGRVSIPTGGGDYARFLKSAREDLDGTIVSAVVKVRCWVDSTTENYTFKYFWKGVQQVSEVKNVTTVETTFSTSSFNFSGNWSDFQNAGSYIQLTVGNFRSINISEAWLEVVYTPSNPTTAVTINESVPAVSNRIVDVLVGGGNSVADKLPLIVDCEGYPDDNPAHYTDVADSLIEEPWDQVHHILENHGNGVTDSDINFPSFQDAEDNLPASYKFAFSIRQKIGMNRLLAMLAQQTWCRFIWEAGIAKLNRIKLTGTSIKAIDTDTDSYISNDRRLQVRKSPKGLSEIINDIEVKYDLNYTLGRWDTPDAFEGSSEDTDATSISNYKTRQRTWLMFAIGNNTAMADDVRDKLLEFYQNPRATFTFPGWLKHVELERGDTPDLTTSQLGAFGRICEIIGVDLQVPHPVNRQRPELIFELLDLLFIILSFTDEAQVSDVLTKIDIDVVLTDGAQAGDVLTKIDVDAVLTDGAQAGDVLTKIDITIPQLADSITAGDVLTQLKSLWKFDSTRKYDSTKKFNSAP